MARVHISWLYDITLPSPYAAAIQILNTARALCALDASVDVHVRALHGSADECLARLHIAPHPALSLHSLPTRRGDVDWATLRARLTHRAASARHVVMSRGESGVMFLPRLGRLERPPGERHVYEAHRLTFSHALTDAEPPLRGFRSLAARVRSWRLHAREAATLRGADAVVCLTHGVQHALETEFGPLRAPLILPSGTTPPLDALPAEHALDIDVMYAGKLELRKGVHLLLDAMRLLPERRAYVVGGSAEQVQAFRRAAHEQGVQDRVTVTGHLEPGAVRALYGRARVGVCALPAGVSPISDRYTSPLKLLEMMSLGVPVVATDVPVVRDLVGDDCALLVPANDAAAFAAGIRRLLDDRVFARAMAARAQEHVKAYTWDARARRLLEHLASLY